MTVPNNPFPALSSKVDPTVLRSIRQASQATSADFGLLMAQASRESGFKANAKSSTSSAAGLFQFVDSTWLDMVHRFGDKYGVGDLAQQISQTSSGKLVVANSGTRQKISRPPLRSDLIRRARRRIFEAEPGHHRTIDRPAAVARRSLYGAFSRCRRRDRIPQGTRHQRKHVAAKILPDAAAANPSIFYDASGRAKTVGEIYQTVASKIEKDASAFGGDISPTAPSSSSPSPSPRSRIPSACLRAPAPRRSATPSTGPA